MQAKFIEDMKYKKFLGNLIQYEDCIRNIKCFVIAQVALIAIFCETHLKFEYC